MTCFYVSPTSHLQPLPLLLQEKIFGNYSLWRLYDKLGNIMLTGDLNARTGVLPDFNKHDAKAFVPLPMEYRPDFNWMRCNTDRTVNSYGKELLNLCVSSNLRIVNGRIGGDKDLGASTCFTPRGSSLVDYFVASIHFFELISDFSIGDLCEHSDHCPIVLDIATRSKVKPTAMYEENNTEKKFNSQVSLLRCTTKWNTVLEQEIRSCFKSTSFLHSLSLFPTPYECLPTELVNKFNYILISAIKSCPSAMHSTVHSSKSSRSLFPRNRWFDVECKRQKTLVSISAKDLKSDPNCVSKKERFWRERKRYKKLIRSKKRKSTVDFHLQLLHLRTSQPREFWKVVSKAEVVQHKHIPIDMVVMATHFQKLNTQYQDPPHIYTTLPVLASDDFLDEEIFEEEVSYAIKRLKRNKAPGLDGLPPELFKAFNNNLTSLLTRIFNEVFNSGIFPKSWSIGSIKPIFKKGDEKLPNNYRGITLLPIMGKLLTSILNDRLLEWAELNKKINDAQFGFRKK